MNEDPRYTDLMQEIKERLYTIEDVLSGRTQLQGPLAHEFCFLQLRFICECISYACVIAHAYIEGQQISRFQKAWSADVLMKQLGRLHQDFYPKPKTMTVTKGRVQLDEINVPYLTKTDLQKLNGICGDKLHRGSPGKYTYNPMPDRLATDRRTIIDFTNKIFRLMESHLIMRRNDAPYILCRLRERGMLVEVWLAAAGHKVAALDVPS
jgi:hypothetical protein